MLKKLGTLVADWIDRNSLTELVFSNDETHVIGLAWQYMPAKYLTSDDVELCNAYRKVLEAEEYRQLIGRAEAVFTYKERQLLRELIDGYCEWMADKLPDVPKIHEQDYLGWYEVANNLIRKLT